MRSHGWALVLGVFFFAAGCAEPADDPSLSFGVADAADSATIDTGPSKDTGGADSSSSDDGVDGGDDTEIDSSELDSTFFDSDPPDSFAFDSDPFDFGPPPDSGGFDFGPPPDGGGTCMWCSTGTCPSPFIDYPCLIDCLSDGHTDCDYDPSKAKPCTCVP